MNPSYTTRKEVFWRFSGVFRIYKMGRLARNGLWKCLQLVKVGYNKVLFLNTVLSGILVRFKGGCTWWKFTCFLNESSPLLAVIASHVLCILRWQIKERRTLFLSITGDICHIKFQSKFYIYLKVNHCVKNVHIRSFSGPYFATFALNTKDKEYFSVFSPNAGKCRPGIPLWRTIFMEWFLVSCILFLFKFSFI